MNREFDAGKMYMIEKKKTLRGAKRQRQRRNDHNHNHNHNHNEP